MKRRLVSDTDIARLGLDVVIVGVVEDVVSGFIYEGKTAKLYLPTFPGGSKASTIIARMRSSQDVGPEALQKLFTRTGISPIAFEAYPLDEALALQLYPLRVSSWIGMVLSGIALGLSVFGNLRRRRLCAEPPHPRDWHPHGARRDAWRDCPADDAAVVEAGVAGAVAGFLIAFTVLAGLRAVVTLPGLTLLDPIAFVAASGSWPGRLRSRRSCRRAVPAASIP